ncbi:MAG: hypothetical protein ABR547_06310 [Halanaerobium sp.]
MNYYQKILAEIKNYKPTNQAEHFHYDIRYLLEADSSEELQKSRESLNLKWIYLNKVANYLSEESVLRMVRKTGVNIR